MVDDDRGIIMDGGWLLRPDECLKYFEVIFFGGDLCRTSSGSCIQGLGPLLNSFFLPQAAPAQFHGAGPLVPKRLGSSEPMFLADTC